MLHITLNSNATAALLGAFSGAIVTFIFDRATDYLRMIRKARVGHHNALIKLERTLSEHGSIANDNLYLIPYFQKALRAGQPYWARLSPFPVDKEDGLKLQDLDLINQLLSYQDSLRKYNDDIKSLQGGYEKLENGLMSGDINQETYNLNAANIANSLDLMKAYLEQYMNHELLAITARVRLLIERSGSRPTERIKRFFIRKDKITKEELSAELKIIKEEIKKNRQESKKIISKIKLKQKS